MMYRIVIYKSSTSKIVHDGRIRTRLDVIYGCRCVWPEYRLFALSFNKWIWNLIENDEDETKASLELLQSYFSTRGRVDQYRCFNEIETKEED